MFKNGGQFLLLFLLPLLTLASKGPRPPYRAALRLKDSGLSIVATCHTSGGTAPYVYKLVVNGQPKATSYRNVFTVPKRGLPALSSWYCIVANKAGQVRSNTIKVTTTTRPTANGKAKISFMDKGLTLEARCTPIGLPAPFVFKFYKNGKLVTKGKSATLTVPKSSAPGQWYCVVWSSAGDFASNRVTIRPSYSKIKSAKLTMRDAGSHVSAKCTTTGGSPATSYKFYKSGILYKAGTKSEIAITKKQVGGVWYCVASNAAGDCKSNIVTISIRKVTNPYPTYPTPNPNKCTSAKLTMRQTGPHVYAVCTVTGGTRATTYKFYKNGAVYTSGSNSVLSIIKSQAAGGWYCVASNSAGYCRSNTFTITIRRVSTPSPTYPTPYPNKCVRAKLTMRQEGSYVIARCTKFGSSAATDYRFYKDGSLYTSGPQSQISIVKSGVEGAWYCVASNAAGTCKSNTVTITIRKVTTPPVSHTVVLKVSATAVNIGTPLTLTGILSSPVPFTKVVFTNGVVTLQVNQLTDIVPAAMKQHGGLWRVTVTTSYGDIVSTPVMVLVVERVGPPTVTLSINPAEVYVGEVVTLTARLQGGVGTRYVFSNGGETIQFPGTGSSNVDVQIKSAQLRHGGQWVVTVFGSFSPIDSNVVVLVVKERPTTSPPKQKIDILVGCARKKFHYSADQMTYDQAIRYCSSMDMKLAVAFDKPELNDIMYELKKGGENWDHYWLAFRRMSGNHKWRNLVCDKVSLLQEIAGEGNCAFVKRANMMASPCDKKRHALCQKDGCDVLFKVNFHSSRYYTITKKLSRDRAQSYCRHLNMELFTIEDMGEMQKVCEPIIDKQMSQVKFWTSPVADQGFSEFVSSCLEPIPLPVFAAAYNDTLAPSPDIRRCTVMLNDVYYAVPCDGCHGFVCEDPGCGHQKKNDNGK